MDVLSRNVHPPHLPCSEHSDYSPGFQSVHEPLTWARNLHQNSNYDLGYHAAHLSPSVTYKGSIERIQLPDDHRLWSPPHETNWSTSRFSYKIHQKPKGVRIRTVCEAASNIYCRVDDLFTEGTGIIKQPLAEWVWKPRFPRPDSWLFHLDPGPTQPGGESRLSLEQTLGNPR